MKDRTLLTISVIFLVVLVASALVYTLGNRPNATKNDPLGLTAINPAQVTKVSLANVTGTAQTLERNNDVWSLNGSPIDGSHVSSFLSSLANAHEALVSRKGRESDAYGLNTDSRKTLTLTESGTDRVYDVGSSDYRTQGVYVAAKGSDDTYNTQGTSLQSFVSSTFTDWLRSTSTATTTPAAPTAPAK